jgi:AcrR family transcriptional regulator
MTVTRTRTQEERRAATRTKLLDATVRSLVDGGLAATTSRRVCELAGVSQGAQTYHFPLRTDLLGAAVEHVAAQRIAALRERAPDFPTDPGERLAALLDHLWADFNSATFVVFVKLWVAAQHDAELHARLVPVERQLAEAIASLSAEVLGTQPDRDLQTRMLIAIDAMRGLALTEHFEPRGRRRRDPWPEMRATMLDTLLAL